MVVIVARTKMCVPLNIAGDMKCTISSFLILLIVLSSQGTNYPFPQQQSFEKLRKPSNFSQRQMDSLVSRYYKQWKKAYLTKAGSTKGGYYVSSNGGTGATEGALTISEAHGWGMIITALMAGEGRLADTEAKEIFDGMVAFYLDHPCESNKYLMSWEVVGDGKGGELPKASSSATDGDLDIAYGLFLGHKQWGSKGKYNYKKLGLDLINKGIYKNIVGAQTKRFTLGSWDKESAYQSRPSDWMPGHLALFAKMSGNSFWSEAIDTTYFIAKNFRIKYAPKTGLISDFVVGKEIKPAPENFLGEFKETDEYYNNACRVPLRVMAHVAHDNSHEGRLWMEQLMEWAYPMSKGYAANIVGGYYLDGRPIRDLKFAAYIAPIVTASMVDKEYQPLLDDGFRMLSLWEKNYYNDTIALLSLLLISGNWWSPTE